MKYMAGIKTIIVTFLFFTFFILNPGCSQETDSNSDLDQKVKEFLKKHKYQWYDMNVPEEDGRLLFDIIVKNNYKSALEIGTSTGHSAIWIAWALSKTGGKLITIEINKQRYREALDNFKEAGLSDYIDARLTDAHDLVPRLKGSFDFVFCDADKLWYKNYFIDVLPKLKTGGCYTAHNVHKYRFSYSYGRSQKEFLDYVESLPNFETTIDNSGAGMSISYKKSD
jgi:caffeoyl-CoA O-methyltransferase